MWRSPVQKFWGLKNAEKITYIKCGRLYSECLKCLNFDGMKKKGKIAWLP